jgi:hypothetical protein
MNEVFCVLQTIAYETSDQLIGVFPDAESAARHIAGDRWLTGADVYRYTVGDPESRSLIDITPMWQRIWAEEHPEDPEDE